MKSNTTKIIGVIGLGYVGLHWQFNLQKNIKSLGMTLTQTE